MDVEERSLELLPMDVQHILLGKLDWTALATLACASKHFLGLVCQSCAYHLDLGLAKTRLFMRTLIRKLQLQVPAALSCRAGAGDKRTASLEYRA